MNASRRRKPEIEGLSEDDLGLWVIGLADRIQTQLGEGWTVRASDRWLAPD